MILKFNILFSVCVFPSDNFASMKINSQQVRQWGSVFFILLLLAFKCADLHQFSHDSKKVQDHCTICQLAHAQSHTDTYLPPQQVVFEPTLTPISATPVVVVYNYTLSPEPLFGIFLNKAPPAVC